MPAHVLSGFSCNTSHLLFIIYHTCCLCSHEDIWILGCHQLNFSGTNPSPSPVPLPTVCRGQCAWNRWNNVLKRGSFFTLFFFTLERENTPKAYQTPRETPSSEVRYMLIVWLREKSAGWLRSLKNSTLTVDRKIVADHRGIYNGSDKEKRDVSYLCVCIQSAGSSLTGA